MSESTCPSDLNDFGEMSSVNRFLSIIEVDEDSDDFMLCVFGCVRIEDEKEKGRKSSEKMARRAETAQFYLKLNGDSILFRFSFCFLWFCMCDVKAAAVL